MNRKKVRPGRTRGTQNTSLITLCPDASAVNAVPWRWWQIPDLVRLLETPPTELLCKLRLLGGLFRGVAGGVLLAKPEAAQRLIEEQCRDLAHA